MKELEGMFQEWIKEGQQQGEISKSFSSLALARHLFNSYQGLKIIAKLLTTLMKRLGYTQYVSQGGV